MKLTDQQRWALAGVIVILAWSFVLCLYLTAPALTYDNCDMRVFAGRIIVCR